MLTVSEVAKLMRVSEQTIRTWLRQNKIHAVRVGRPWRIPESAIMEMIERRKPQGA